MTSVTPVLIAARTFARQAVPRVAIAAAFPVVAVALIGGVLLTAHVIEYLAALLLARLIESP
jgi:hypothetical protein